jgi:hypothetical protein
MFLLSLLVGTLFCGGQIAYLLQTAQDPLHREMIESTIVLFTLVLCAAIFLAMVFFVAWSLFLILTNQTAIEFQINRGGGGAQSFLGRSSKRSPYDLGRWRNVMEVFATAGDVLTERFQHRRPPIVQAVLVLAWAVLPSWQPLATDGIAYRRWDDNIV